MVWQDIIVSLTNLIFIYAMLPQIIYGFKTKKGLISIQFSGLNILAMIGLIFVYASFDLPFSIILTIILIILWIILLFQRLKYKKVKK
tara:strand:- start:10899 stop:11162 length:264 start_codon:yes stop_codon:yes gene_type:complete